MKRFKETRRLVRSRAGGAEGGTPQHWSARTMSTIEAGIKDIRALVAPIAPHLGAIEHEVLDVQQRLGRIERILRTRGARS